MRDSCIFLNCRVENSGTLAWIGDKGLAPFRYLFNGKTIRIQHEPNEEIKIHHVASFHKIGKMNSSRTNSDLTSSSTSMIKAALSVVFLIPGLILGAPFKGLAYLFSSVREKHGLAKEHLTPVDRQIGDSSNPIKTREDLTNALFTEFFHDSKHRPTNALIIHGDGNLTINEEQYILPFNPMKLVLVGARIVRKSPEEGQLDDAMRFTHKWQVDEARVETGSKHDTTYVISHSVDSIDEALQVVAPKRSWTSCKRYHMIFTLPRPQGT